MAGMQGLHINTGRGRAGGGPRGSMQLQPWASGTYPAPHAGFSPGMPPSRSSGPFHSPHAGNDPALLQASRSLGQHHSPRALYDQAPLASRPSGSLQLPQAAYGVASLESVQQAQQLVAAAAAQARAYEQQQQLLLQGGVHAVAASQLVQGPMGRGLYAAAAARGPGALPVQQPGLHSVVTASGDSALSSSIRMSMPVAGVARVGPQASSKLLQGALLSLWLYALLSKVWHALAPLWRVASHLLHA